MDEKKGQPESGRQALLFKSCVTSEGYGFPRRSGSGVFSLLARQNKTLKPLTNNAPYGQRGLFASGSNFPSTQLPKWPSITWRLPPDAQRERGRVSALFRTTVSKRSERSDRYNASPLRHGHAHAFIFPVATATESPRYRYFPRLKKQETLL